MTVRSRAAKKARRAQQREMARAATRRVDTWILALQLRALNQEQRHGSDTDSGQYAFGVAVACRQAVKDRLDVTSAHLTGAVTTSHARCGFEDALALIHNVLKLGEPPSGDYGELLHGLVPESSHVP